MTCRAEYPHLVDLQSRYGGEKFQVVSIVTLDSSETAIRAFLGDLKPNFPIVAPKDEQALTEALDIRGMPVNFIVGPDGRIVVREEGPYQEAKWERDVLPHIPGAA